VPAETFTGVTLARILRPRGLRGEVAAEILTDFPDRLPSLREVWLADGRTEPRRIKVQRCWLSTGRGGQAIFHFAGVENVEAAERLRGCEVQVPLEQRAKLAAVPPASHTSHPVRSPT
jgi:16S rRNA processing protein RimM